MSKNLDRYWQIEYQLQKLWAIEHHIRDYPLISVLNKELQDEYLSILEADERRQLEDSALCTH